MIDITPTNLVDAKINSKDLLIGLTKPSNHIGSIYDKLTYGNIALEDVQSNSDYSISYRIVIDSGKKFLVQVLEIK